MVRVVFIIIKKQIVVHPAVFQSKNKNMYIFLFIRDILNSLLFLLSCFVLF